jgi:RHS repeat-associated protein
MTTFGSCTYKTDAEGNVVSRKGTSPCVQIDSLFWTAEGQLDSVKIGSTGIKYRYDASGRLVQKRVNGTSSSYFLWEGDNLVAELNGTANAVKAEYSYYPGLDNLQALIVGGTVYYARTDGLGNVLALSDTTKAVKSTYEYDDWGHLTVGGDSASFNGVDRARWKGALWMGSEVELYYMRNRWYEPYSGRFLSEDPIGLDGGINPSVFAGNDPVNLSDPSGLCKESYSFSGGVLSTTVCNPTWTINTLPWGYEGVNPTWGVAYGHPVGDLSGIGRGGYSPRQRARNPSAPRKDPAPTIQCDVARAAFWVSAAVDATLVVGVFARGAMIGFRLFGAFIVGGLERVAEQGAFRGAIAGVDAAAGQLWKGAVKDLRPRPYVIGVSATASAAAGLGVSVWDFLPLVGSYRAHKAMKEACQ